MNLFFAHCSFILRTDFSRFFTADKAAKLSLSFLTLAFLVTFSAKAQAATYTLSTTANTGAGSLRQAITDANNTAANDEIVFASSLNNQTITLGSEIVINNNGSLTINGLGANSLTIHGGPASNRIFYLSGATVAINDVTLTGGNGEGATSNGNGGAIFAESSNLTLDRVHVTGNTTSALAAGVYFNLGTSRIRNSTFSSNNSSVHCGGFYNGGGSVTVVNSTFSGNTAANIGGGICSDGNTTLRNVTIANNSASRGGGFFQNTSGRTMNFANTIVAGNTGTTSEPEIYYLGGTVTSAGNNLVGDSAGDSTNTFIAVSYQTSDIRDTPPQLGVLQNNGGRTPMRALLSGSPAIDAGSDAQAVDPSNGNAPLTTDQRGYRRISSGTAFAFLPLVVDIGAFEFNSSVPTAASVAVTGRVLAATGKGISRAVVYLTDAEGNTKTALTNSFGYYRFEGIQAGKTYVFNVFSKRYSFQPQIVTVTEEIENLNFTAEQ